MQFPKNYMRFLLHAVSDLATFTRAFRAPPSPRRRFNENFNVTVTGIGKSLGENSVPLRPAEGALDSFLMLLALLHI